MFRVVALLLALLIPLQFAWGAAAAYCQHESGADASTHIGHHEHVHKAEAKKHASGKLIVDDDCASCHATCSALASEASAPAALPPQTRRLFIPLSDAPASALPRAPDRPQWLRLA